ncbi:MAG: 50S ribosomal protein L1 [Gemmataceae bacterium]|nr:50S ribosomal protein L1 [Gemmataceae bacterium]
MAKEKKDQTVPSKEVEAKGAPAPVEAAAVVPASGKETRPDSGAKKKGQQPGNPPRVGKKLRGQILALKTKVINEGEVSLKKAISLLKQGKHAKFDETVEIHMSLGIDTTQSDQMIRGSVALPHGVGKKVRVLVFCQGENVAKAKEAGADYVGDADLVKKIQSENWLDFDVALATQDMMGQVSRLGKVLGPRGLMPTPKAGTVVAASQDIGAAIREFKAGKVEYRADKGGNVHGGVGKMSFEDDKILENASVFVEQVRAAKPSGIKGHFVKSITLSATMSPGFRVMV